MKQSKELTKQKKNKMVKENEITRPKTTPPGIKGKAK